MPEANPAQRTLLLPAVKRVVERRLENIGEVPEKLEVDPVGSTGGKLTVRLAEPAAAETLDRQLQGPFTLRVTIATGEKDAEVTVEGQGGFKQTGITEAHIDWMTAVAELEGKGRVVIAFTPEGRTLMGNLFKKNKGEYLGLFVRDRLMAKLLIDSDTLQEDIVITGIPTLEIAQAFADDVNVGLYVTFVPTEK